MRCTAFLIHAVYHIHHKVAKATERANHEKTGNEQRQRQKSVHANSKQSKENQHQTKNKQRRHKIMTLPMYAIKDELNGFAPPIPMANDDVAKRYFREMLQGNSTMKIEPKDFSIWAIGSFDTETGETENNVILLERG